jgi:hypothetical protein
MFEYKSDEDEMLTIAWVSATDNPIAGVGQKAITFWSDVHAWSPSYRKNLHLLKQSFQGHGID